MSKSELCSMTWTELKERFEDNPAILIPMGSVEQHGPTTPVGDYRYMTEICKEVAKRTRAISCPTIPWGYSEVFKNFPGTITLRPKTLKSILIDHIDCFVRFDLDHIMFVCGHKGNLPIIEQVSRQIKEEYGLRVATIEPLGWLDKNWREKAYGSKEVSIGHGSDPMLSIAMHLFPEEVRMDLYEDSNEMVWNNNSVQGVSNLLLEDNIWHMYLDYDEITPNGVIGDAKKASPKIGESAVNRMIDISTKVVNKFNDIDTRVSF